MKVLLFWSVLVLFAVWTIYLQYQDDQLTNPPRQDSPAGRIEPPPPQAVVRTVTPPITVTAEYPHIYLIVGSN